jgi:predicted acetyltransferase
MSDIVVRPYEPRDQEQTWHVRAMTYNSGRPIPVEQQVYKTSTPYVGEVDGQVVGTFVVMDMTCTRGNQAAWKTGGIAGVAVLPEARQTGVGSAMMRWALRHMRENGYVLASLYAFRESYYRRFGYEVCGTRQKVTCPNSRLPRHKAELPVRRVPYAELDSIKPCYEQFARARGGMNLRSNMHWGRIIIDDQVKTIYAAGDPVEAYVILEHDWTFWQDQPVGELAWTTTRGYESILSALSSIGINKTSVTWYEPSDGLFMTKHVDQGARFEVEKPVMYRLLDLPSAFDQLSSSGEGEFSLSIQDQEIPENNGPWQICYAGGKTRIERCETAELQLDAHTMVQALLGQPSLDDLVRNGMAQDCEPARRLLPPLPVYCMDFF